MNEDKNPLSFIPFAGPILGGLQALVGLFSPKGPRPKWQIPGAAYEQLGMARTQAAATTRPGNQYALDQIGKASASAVGNVNRTAGSGATALVAADKIQSGTQNAINANNAQNAAFTFNSKQNLQNQLGKFAALQREQFIQNVMEPYQQRARTQEALVGAGIQNIFGGINNAASIQMQQNFLRSMYGNQNNQP